jgi:hypothetical protein
LCFWLENEEARFARDVRRVVAEEVSLLRKVSGREVERPSEKGKLTFSSTTCAADEALSGS